MKVPDLEAVGLHLVLGEDLQKRLLHVEDVRREVREDGRGGADDAVAHQNPRDRAVGFPASVPGCGISKTSK